MFPILFSLGPVTLYTYGVVVFIAALLALFIIFKRGRELRIPEDQLFDALLASMVVSLLVGRVGFVLSNWGYFNTQVFNVINLIGTPGIGEMSSLVGLVAGVVWQCHKRKWDVFQVLDVVLIGITLWQAILGFGDLLNGSKAGLPTHWPIGLRFAHFYEKRLPVQIWEMVTYALLFIWLWRVESKYRTFSWYKGPKSQANSGFISSMYFIIAGFIGFTASNFRPQSIQIFSIPVIPFLFLAMLCAGLVLLFNRSGMNLKKILKDWMGLNPLLPR